MPILSAILIQGAAKKLDRMIERKKRDLSVDMFQQRSTEHGSIVAIFGILRKAAWQNRIHNPRRSVPITRPSASEGSRTSSGAALQCEASDSSEVSVRVASSTLAAGTGQTDRSSLLHSIITVPYPLRSRDPAPLQCSQTAFRGGKVSGFAMRDLELMPSQSIFQTL